MNSAVNYWYIFGFIYLSILTYQDYKNKRRVDDRKNWVMFGITISLISHVPTSFIYKIGLIFFVIFLSFYFPKIKGIGEADFNTFSWIFLGLGIINPFQLILYLVILTGLSLIYLFLKNIIFKYKPAVQYYGVILLSFIINYMLRI